MTLDWIDRAFVSRVAKPPPAPAAPAATPAESPARTPGDAPVGAVAVADATTREGVVVDVSGEETLARLLAEVPGEWRALADAIEAAAASGRRVVAITGVRRGEGRSTVAAGVAAALRARGRSVAIVDRSPLFLAGDAARAARAADVVLVDAGPWFQPGPVRRGMVERAALGCDGVLLVRRDDALPCPARERVLEAIGLLVVGEAVTFAAAS